MSNHLSNALAVSDSPGQKQGAQSRWHGILQGLLRALLVIACVAGSIFLSRIPASHFADLSPFWPVTGIAIFLLQRNPWYLISLSLGVMLWAFLDQLPGQFILLLPLMLVGPLFYAYLKKRGLLLLMGASRSDLSIGNYVSIGLVAVLPSTLMGSYLYHLQTPEYAYLDTFLVYGLSEFLGVLIFLPLTEGLVKWFSAHKAPQIKPVVYTALIGCFPVLLDLLGYKAYATAADILIFPIFAAMISGYNRQSLIFSSFVLAIIITFSAGYGAGQIDPDEQVGAFLFVTFWLIAVLLSTHALHQSISSQRRLLAKNLFLATHNENTNMPNNTQLAADFNGHASGYLNVVQVRNRESINQSLTTTEKSQLEKEIALQLKAFFPELQVYHIAELRFAIISDDSIREEAETLQIIQADLGMSGTYIELAWGLMHCSSEGFDKTMAHAHAALSIALNQPNNRVYGPDLNSQIEAQLSKLNNYQRYMHALENGGLVLCYQPIMDLHKGRVTTAEILSRLFLDEEMVGPVVFTEVLKSFDALSKFDRLVIAKALRFLDKKPLSEFDKININITGASLSDSGFIPWLKESFPANIKGMPRICFEITESDHIRNWKQAIANADALRKMGFLLAVDDFGTGLASFEYLNEFSMAGLLKIDGAFIKDLADDDKQKAFVEASMMIAKSRGLEVCAEYVDNQETIDYLTEAGVNYAQGFFISKPLMLKY